MMENFRDLRAQREVPTEEPYLCLDNESREHLNSGDAAAHAWFIEYGPAVLSGEFPKPCLELVEVLLRFVQWHFKNGDYREALPFATKAVEIATSSSLPALQRRSLNLLGSVQTNLCDFTQATVSFTDALQIADQIGDRIGRAAVLGNLATLRFNAGLVDESIELNRYVLNITDGEPQYQTLAANAHHNIAAASILLRDFGTATTELKKAEALLPGCGNQFMAFQRVIFDATWCKLLVSQGHYTAAEQYALHAEQLADEMNSRSARAQATIARALLQSAQGESKIALKELDSLRSKIRMDEPVYRDLLEVEAFCAEKLGDDAQAALLRMRLLSHSATFQRRFVIRQVAAFQRTLRDCANKARAEERPLLVRSPGSRRAPSRIGNIQSALREQLEALASLADQRESSRTRHSERVGRLAELLAVEIGYEKGAAAIVGLGGRLHDIGKLTIPDIVLLKNDKLSSMETEIVRRHTIEGSQILVDILSTTEGLENVRHQTEALRTAADIALHHHEWWDGSGYPRQIGGEKISEPAQLAALADTFDEMTGPRPYKPVCQVDDAVRTMSALSGRQFDPDLFASFERLIRRLQSKYGKELEHFAPILDDASVYQRAYRVIEAVLESPRNSQNRRDSTSGLTQAFDHSQPNPIKSLAAIPR